MTVAVLDIDGTLVDTNYQHAHRLVPPVSPTARSC